MEEVYSYTAVVHWRGGVELHSSGPLGRMCTVTQQWSIREEVYSYTAVVLWRRCRVTQQWSIGEEV